MSDARSIGNRTAALRLQTPSFRLDALLRASGQGEPGSGGTSTSANSGLLRSPTIALPAGQSAILEFETWFEIESVNPNDTGYDLMEVLVIDGGSGVVSLLGKLNPQVDPNVPNRNAIPFTSGGFNRAPDFRGTTYDLSPWAGRNVQVAFRFQTVDQFYNGFRGWIVDDVRVTRASSAVSPLALGSGFSVTQVGRVCGDEICWDEPDDQGRAPRRPGGDDE